MNLGKKLSIGAMTMGLAFGGIALTGAGCGSSGDKVQESGEKSCGAGSCGGEKAHTDDGGEKSCGAGSCGGEKKDDGGGEQSCGAGSCG
ncbi:MAG: hypothetical protein KC635_14990 [Myxococcales bacterium]|nr:hypothetical protein [Myxococcales bacterium]MCB9736183.1 hypothetical protein [Deltaproteobacteria bacterium]